MDETGRKVEKRSVLTTIETILCVLFVLYHLYTAWFGMLSGLYQRGVHLALLLTLFYITQFKKPNVKRIYKIIFALMAALGIAGVLYVCATATSYEMRAGIVYTADIVFGLFLMVSLIFAAWKGVGKSLAIIVLIFVAYAFCGESLPGLLAHTNLSLGRFVTLSCMTTEGIFGQPLYASANQIALFVILGAVFTYTGVGNYFTSFATAIFGRMVGGPAKVAVVASGFFGSINGSAVANVIGTGTFTIPMMKKNGFDPEFAGAVEASASTGGQIMPPIMGTTAFIAAELLAISYWDFAKSAVIPALLYYVALIMAVDLYARRRGLKAVSQEDLPDLKELLKKSYLFTPLIFLVLLLAVFRVTITRAGLYTLAFTIVISFFSKDTRLTKEKLLLIARSGATGMTNIAIACGTVGIIIAMVQGTGLAYRLSSILTVLAGNSILILLLLTMVCSIILGMGVPTSAAYTILAILVAPTLVKLGLPALAAHMFVFYFGVISNVTPPVALAAYAAAGVSQANPNRTGYKAFFLALSGFILPFMFVYNPTLLGIGSFVEIARSLATSLLGVYFISCTTQGMFHKWKITWAERILLMAASFMLIDAGIVTDLLGIAVFAAELIVCRFVRKKAAA